MVGVKPVISFHCRNTCASSAAGRCFYAAEDSKPLSVATEEECPLRIHQYLFSPSNQDSLCVLVLLLLVVFVVCFPSCDTREKIAPCEVVMEITVGAVSGSLGTGLTWRAEIAEGSGSCERFQVTP